MIMTFSCDGLQPTEVKIIKCISWAKLSRSCFSFPGKTFLKLKFSWPLKQPHNLVLKNAFHGFNS